MSDLASRQEIEAALDDILNSEVAGESLKQAIVRIGQGDLSGGAESIQYLLRKKIDFNREMAERYPDVDHRIQKASAR